MARKYIDPAKRKRAEALWIILPALIDGGCFILFTFFPHLLRQKFLLEVQYMEYNHTPRVIRLYQEIASTEDDRYLTGYWLYITDPVAGKKTGQLFIKRKSKNYLP